MRKTKYILKGFLAVVMAVMFVQCAGNNGESTQTAAPVAATGTTNMKIAYVEIDSLLTKYRFWNDLNELMIKKEENIRTTLNEKAKALDAAMKEFQRKYENNGFVSAESASSSRTVSSNSSRIFRLCRKNLARTLLTKTRKTAFS